MTKPRIALVAGAAVALFAALYPLARYETETFPVRVRILDVSYNGVAHWTLLESSCGTRDTLFGHFGNPGDQFVLRVRRAATLYCPPPKVAAR